MSYVCPYDFSFLMSSILYDLNFMPLESQSLDPWVLVIHVKLCICNSPPGDRETEVMVACVVSR